jgi:molybdopterin/thiamine biosynthesis adenylyltransferase
MGQADRTVALLQRLAGPTSDRRQLPKVLAPGRAAVVLDRAIAGEPQAQLLFSFAVNLLARLYPIVQSLEVVAPPVAVGTRLPRWAGITVDEHTRNLLVAVNPPVRWTVIERPRGDAECALIVGSVSTRAPATVFVGSDGWLARLSPTAPVPVSADVNPVGAYAAACLGVGEVCKRLLTPHRELFDGTPIIPIEGPLAFSTFNYQADAAGPNPELPATVDLRRLTLVGVGAGGGALAFTLASLPNLRGILRLIEPDEVIDPNLNRYVWADAADALAQREKANVAAALFDGVPHVRAMADPRSFHDAAPSLVPADYRYVVAAVHSREARRELQLETPMVLWDAGATDHGEFFAWRMTLGKTECMHCKHPPGLGDPERDKAVQLAHLLGLGIETWIGKVRDNEVFHEDEISFIANRAETSAISIDLPRPGQRYSDWEQAQCGKLRLPEVDDEIPFACAPVMAGVLLAGEIIKEHYFPDVVLDSYYWNTLLGRFMTRNQPRRRPPRHDCAFCQDDVYLAQYRRRWQQR